MPDNNCPICNQIARSQSYDGMSQLYSYICPVCGSFNATSMFARYFSSSLTPINKAALSGYVREMNSLDKQDITISVENYQDILNSSIIARSVSEKLKKLILYLYRLTDGLGRIVKVNPDYDFSVCYALNSNEFIELVTEARRKGFVCNGDSLYLLKLDYSGIVFAENLMKETSISNSAFVAMWFSPEMFSVYDKAIKPAIESEECGKFKAFRVDNHEHNNDITDEIIAGIKACRFMVADMTGYRGGVYYEAGFARGLGKPVIYTCRKDWFDGELSSEGKPIKERIHFDINHMNIIVWENPEELKQRIINRIRATII